MRQKEKNVLNFPVIISMSLVLFTLGILFISGGYFYKITYELKEKLPVEIFLKDKINSHELNHLSSYIKSLDYIKSFKYIDKKEALEIARKELGIKKEDLLDDDIFPASIKLTLKSKNTDLNQIDQFLKKIQSNPNVEEIKHFKNLLEKVYLKIEKYIFWIGGFFLFFLTLAILFIYNILVLFFRSKKNIIKNLKLTGTKKKIIYFYFIKQIFYCNFLSSILASLALTGLIYILSKKLNLGFFSLKEEYQNLGIIFSSIFLMSIFISLISTCLIVSKVLKSKNI